MCATNPTAIAAAKKPIILPIAMPIPSSPLPLSREMKRERSTTPMMSSRIAAATMEVPTFVLSFPSSLRAATVILTLVAANIAP